MHIRFSRRRLTPAETYRKSYERDSWTAFAAAAAIIIGLAAILILAHYKRAERDSRVEMEHTHYDLMAVTGGVK